MNNYAGVTQMFTSTDLRKLIIPLFLEQLLVMLVGMADIFVVSYVSEAAVSGVSLVNSFNTIFVNLFAAHAAGGAVVISQYIGKGDTDRAGVAASQLLVASVLFSLLVTVAILPIGSPLMRLIFGRVEADVMDACVTYLRISAYSYPALAIYNAGAAVYRSIGRTGVTMYISVVSNVINFVGNCIGVFVLHVGVAGVAWPSLIARVFSAAAITALCCRQSGTVHYIGRWLLRLDRELQAMTLRIAVPNGIESGIFQLVKVALSSVVAMFGTYQIAANGVAQSIWSLAALVCVSMGPVFITVIGQCMGAGDSDAAEYYFKKLLRITVVFAIIWNALIFAATPVMMHFYSLAPETKELIIKLVLIHNVFNALAFPFADPLGKGLRATGDVTFTMATSLFTTIGVRLVLSVLLGVTCGFGVIGIAWAMAFDWCVRAGMLCVRFVRGKWKKFKVIRE